MKQEKGVKKMIKKIIVISVIFFAFLGCLACAKTNELQNNTSEEKGKKIVFEFGSNPTTGFDWVYETGSGDGMIELVDNKYVGNANADRLGAGGIRTFVFKGVKEGKQTIIFTYKRNWEGGENAYDIVYEVEVDKNLDIKYLDKHIGKIETNNDLSMFPNPSFSE